MLSDEEKRIRLRLKTDFPHYARKCLHIRTKAGPIIPLRLNQPQIYLHDRLQQLKHTTGKVRAIVLKGRQQGVSTYIGARYYWLVTHRFGRRVFIMTHHQDATNALFGMVQRYHDNVPSVVRPATSAANAKELFFSALDSGYAVGTAGTKAVGRSQTIQFFHGSEVAFWPDAENHFGGVMQTVPDLPGTEIILESTANGLGGAFHERWQKAEKGIGDYVPIFIPWYWSDEYRRPAPPGFALEVDERRYAEAYGLDNEQMSWRRDKIIDLKDPMLFMQEYPATAAEAFQATGHDSFIQPELVMAARKNSIEEGVGPLILGVDPARLGTDRFAVAWRRGRKVLKVEQAAQRLNNVDGANWVRQIIDVDKPARVFIDTGGQGAGVYDILADWGQSYSRVVRGVDFGSKPLNDFIFLPTGEKRPGPANRRAEMWAKSKEWLQAVGGADIPDRDSLQADACGPSYRYNVHQQLLIEAKADMLKRGIRSPDEWDAVALTFAEPVTVETPRDDRERYRKRDTDTNSWQSA